MSTYVPVLLDIFENHRLFLVKELEPSITSVAHSCRKADIITQEFYDELIQVPDTNKRKARKLVNAVSDGIEAQPVDIEQKNCIYQCFVGVLRQDSFERAAVKLEASLAEREERTNNNVACTEDVGNRGDPLDQTITSDHRDEIGKNLSYWKKYAKALRLCDAEIEGIDGDKTLDYVMRGQKVLELWSHKYIATYRILGEVCLKLDHRHIAERIYNMVNGDLSNLSCPDDTIVKDSIYFEAPRVSEDASGPIAFSSTVTSPDMPGQLEVETMRPKTSLEKRASYVPGVEDVQSSLPLPQPSQESNSSPQGIVTVKEIVDCVGISLKDLNKEISREHLLDIGPLLKNWKLYADLLELTSSQIQGIQVDLNLSYGMKGQEVLKLWHEKQVFKATYCRLVDVCLKLKHCDVARDICNIVKKSLGHPLICGDEPLSDNEGQGTGVKVMSLGTTHGAALFTSTLNTGESSSSVRQRFPSPQLATSEGPDERVVSEAFPPISRKDSKREQISNIMKGIENLSVLCCEDDIDVENYQDECKELRQQLKRAKKKNWKLEEKLKYNKIKLDELYKQKCMMEISDRSIVTNMNQKLQRSSATNEELDEKCRKLKLSIDKREKEKETLTDKLEESNHEIEGLRARFSEMQIELDELTLKHRKLAEEHERCPKKFAEATLLRGQHFFLVCVAVVIIFVVVICVCAWLSSCKCTS